MKSKASLRAFLLGSTLLAGQSAFAQSTYTWANSNVAGATPATRNWFGTTQGTWTGGTPVSSNLNTIQFFQDITTQLTNTGATQISNIDNSGSAFQLGTLTLSGRGGTTSAVDLATTISGDALNFSALTGTINLNAIHGSRTLTYNVNSAIQLGTVSSASALTLTGSGNANFVIGGGISELQAGGGSLTKSGTSTVRLSGTNTYTGTTTISGGTLQLGNGGTTGSLSTSSAIVNNGTFTINRSNAVTQGTHFSGAAITGSGNFTQASSSGIVTTLNANNTYTGVTTVSSGVLAFATAADGGLASNLGQSSNAAANLVINGFAELRYTGSGGSTDRLFTLTGTGGSTISSGGTGAINFTNTGAIAYGTNNAARTLTLYGTNTGNNTLAALIQDNGTGKVSLNKDWNAGGSGTWVITGNNTYTGDTRIDNGTVIVSSLKNTGTASNLGAGGTIRFGSFNPAGTLIYQGTGDETNRALDFSASGGLSVMTIDQSGTGLLKFTGTFTMSGASNGKTIRLQGSTAGTGEMQSILVDNSPTNRLNVSKSGTGIWTLSGANTYTGATTVSAGTLNLTGTLGSGGGTAISVNGGNFNESSAGVIAGTSSLTVANGTATLAGANTFTGSVTLNSGGTLKLANANAVQYISKIDVTQSSSNSNLWLANDTAINNLVINATSPAAQTLTRVIVDRATAGAAVDQTMTFTNLGQKMGWTFQKGSLVTSGTPTITASGDTTYGVNSAGTGTIINPLGVNMSLGAVAAAGSGTAGISSTLALDGTSTGNKVTGVLSNGSSASSVTGTLSTSTGNTITLSATPTGFVAGMTISGTGIAAGTVITGISTNTLTLSQAPSSPSGTITGAVANVTNLIKAGSGTWALQNANTYTGTTTVQGGTLNLDFSAATAPATDILYNGYTVSGTGVRPAVTVSGGNLQLTGKGSGGANVQNLSVLISSGSNAGKVTVGGGVSGSTVTLQVATLTVNNGGLLDFNGMDANNIIATNTPASSFVSNYATVNGYTDFARTDGSKNIGAAGANISAALPASVGGTGNYYTLSGTPTLTANTAFRGIRATGSSGTLDLGTKQLQAGSASNSAFLYNGAGTFNITNGTLISSSTGATEFVFYTASGSTINIASNAAINDNTGLLSVLTGGLGTVSVAGGKNFTGTTRVLGGTYSIDTLANGGTASGLGMSTNVASNLVINGGTVQYTGSEATPATNRSFTIGANGATLDASGTNALTWAPAVALGLSSNQYNYLTLTGSNTGANTFGGSTGVIADTATSSTALTKTGAGKWVLAGANTYTGGTNLTQGTLGLTGTETAGTSGPLGKSGDIVFNGGILQYSATNNADYSKRLLRSTSAIAIDTNGRSVTYASAIDSSNTGGLTKLGTGDLTLSGTNTYTGTTTVTAGTLNVTGSLADSSAVIVNGGTYTVGASDTVGTVTLSSGTINGSGTLTGSSYSLTNSGTVSAVLAGSGVALTKTGAGSVTLSGANTYTGATTVSGGTLLVNGSTSASSAVSVASGAALGGDGTVGGSTTFNNGSIFAWNLSVTDPSSSVADTLAVTGNLVDGDAAGGSVFKIVLAGAQTFTSAFWDTNQSWSNVLTSGNSLALQNLFTSFSYENANGVTLNPSSRGSFTLSGSTLNFTAVPEPTSALAGLLLGAGLLRRRRTA